MRSQTLFAIATVATVAACGPVLGSQPELPRPAASDFPEVFAPPGAAASASTASTPPTASASAGPSAAGPSAGATPAPRPSYDPFADAGPADVATTATFSPVLEFQLPQVKAGDTPPVTTSVYQAAGELQVGELDTLIEHASFHFEKLTVGAQIGSGSLEVGTPPKLTLPVVIKVEDTDNKAYALLSAKSDSTLAHIYLADIQVRVLYGSLAIVSLGNAARAAAQQGNPLMPHSAKVTQTIDAGYVQLPSVPGTIRTRAIMDSVPEPSTQTTGRKVVNSIIQIGA